MKRKDILDVILSLIVFLFLYAAMSKLMDFTAFRHAMHNQVLPAWSKPYLLWIVPFSEIAVCLCFLYPSLSALRFTRKAYSPNTEAFLRRLGLYGALILMLLFTGYVGGAVLHLYSRTPCSCGGVIRKLSWGQHLTLNIVFTVLAAIGIYLDRKLTKGHSEERQPFMLNLKTHRA